MTASARILPISIPFFLLALTLVLAAAPVPSAAQSSLLPGGPAASAADTGEAETAATTLTAEQTEAIAELLRDESAREALIAELERLAAERAGLATDDAATPSADAPRAAAPGSIGQKLAQETKEIAALLASEAVTLWQQLGDVRGAFAGLEAIDLGVFADALVDLALVIFATIGLFLALRLLAFRVFRWMGRAAHAAGVLGKGLLVVAGILVDALVVLVAWAGGYALAVMAFGEFGEIGIRQSLYLNAFLAVEMVKVGIRGVLSPAVGELRPVHLPDGGARKMWRMLNVVVSLTGYGQLLIVPIVNAELGFFVGRSVSAFLLLLAMLVLAVSVLRNRRAVAAWLLGEQNGARRSSVLRRLAGLWHLPVLLYLVGFFVIIVTRPGDMLLPVLSATAEVLIACAVGWVTAGLLGRAIASGVRLPGWVNTRLPLLERRLNTFVPRALFALRTIVLVAVVGYAVDALGLLEVGRWIESSAGVQLTTTLVSIALVLLFALAAWLALSSWVEYRLNPEWGSVPSARESTLLTLLRNAVTVTLVVVTLMFVLSEIGIDIAPLIASAGVIGLAIGFGAQKLVQDIIGGIFIQLENAMNVGDVVTAGGTTGVVERLTVRSVSLRDLSGVYHIIPFSSVDMVSNFMREFAFVVADIGIAYRESVDEAKQAMFDAFDIMKTDVDVGPSIIGDLQWMGVNSFGESSVNLRARIKTLPGQQWAVGRAYNEVVKRVLDERGIEIPFPHRTLFFGENKDGGAPRAHVAIDAVPPRPEAAD